MHCLFKILRIANGNLLKHLMLLSQGGWFSVQGIQAEVLSNAEELQSPNLYQGKCNESNIYNSQHCI